MSEIVDRSNGARSERFEAEVSNSLSPASQTITEEKQWAAALNSRDCKRLMALLDQHPRLWLKTTPDDRSVLHVAVIQGCVKLVKQVLLGLPGANGNRETFQENLKMLLDAKDGKCRADAFQLSDIVGNQEVKRILVSARNYLDSESVGNKEDIQGVLNSADSPDASHHTDMKSTDLDSFPEVEFNDLLNELPNYELLQNQMKRDVDYNFEEQRKGLVFNFACKKAYRNKKFIKSVVNKSKEKPKLLQKLFNQRDAKGRTPLHVAVEHWEGEGDELKGIVKLLKYMPDECVNALDGAGRTPLLRATANGMDRETSEVVEVLAKDERTDLNAKWPGESGATALHLAVLHSHGPSARFVLEAHRENPHDLADVELKMRRRIQVYKDQVYLTWTPLELAAVTGRHYALVRILQGCRGQDRGPIEDRYCLHLAAAAGDPLSIQSILLNQSGGLQNFDTNQHFRGYSCLHFAVSGFQPHQPSHTTKPAYVKAIDDKFDRFLAFSDFASIRWLEAELTGAQKGPGQKVGLPIPGYGGKQACANLLLQAGVDIWPKAASSSVPKGLGDDEEDSGDEDEDDDVREDEEDAKQDGQQFKNKIKKDLRDKFKRRKKEVKRHHRDFHDGSRPVTHIPPMPDPGGEGSDDARIWWFELVAKETLEAKNSFNNAGNAVAVVATLVATATFVGPLNPPLGYGSDDSISLVTVDQVQMASRPVRLFMASSSISFYLGIAAIMLAIMPSLPMPQEGLREELRRSRRTVSLAIVVLLLSMLGLLISFTAALVAVLPSQHYKTYALYPALVGGIICGLVIFLFFMRLLRLVFNKNATIKYYYHFFGKL